MAAVRCLNVYSSRESLPPGVPHVALLFPLWGLTGNESTPNVYAPYLSNGTEYFRMTSPDEADVFVLPFDWRYTTRFFASSQTAEAAKRAALVFASRAADFGKPLVAFFVSDSDDEVPLPNSVIFRTSTSRDLRQNEFGMPVFFEDVLQSNAGIAALRLKKRFPTVGFCGFAGYRLVPNVPLRGQIRSFARWVRKGFPQLTLRERAIVALRRHPFIETDFILRETSKGRGELPPHVRQTFQRNIQSTDYTLCVRGHGNWSVRFYETLAWGRIPLFVDTSCVLPYDFEINYRDVSLWVTSEEIDSIADRLVDFHGALDADQFAHLQRACRSLWEQRLTPDGFFSNFWRHFQF